MISAFFLYDEIFRKSVAGSMAEMLIISITSCFITLFCGGRCSSKLSCLCNSAEVSVAATAKVAAEKMTILAKGIKDILTAFATAKFVSSFTVDEDDIADKIFAESSFIEVLSSLRVISDEPFC